MNVLHWIRNRSTIFKPFVANRIGEIQYHSNPIQWRHVQGKQNPADILSRGCSISYLETNELWWNAPEFLKKNECEWPKSKVEFSHENSEIKKSKQMQFEVQTMHTQSADVQTCIEEWRLDPKRYSSWTKLVRVYAWVMRFVENCKRTKTARIEGQLGANEIHDAEVKLIIKAQRSHYKEEFTCLSKQKELPKDSKLIKLNPKIDGEGVIRSDGRLKYAEMLSYDCRYPVILPRHDWITELIVRHFHEDSGHSGTNYTLSVLSTQYWIPSAREVIRAVENKCTKCKLRKARPKEQIMAPLPNIRHNMPLRAFVHVAVDYAGPFVTVQGRGKRREKRYLCLFTCLSTRAVHLEIAFGMDVDSFLNAFYRMVSRRGLPKTMLSDNGSNFVRADKELKQLLQCLDQDKIIENTANKGIQWQFIPPFAPHWGGVHEIMIKSAKRATYAILQNASVTDEELMTAFAGAEGLINSRPLTYQTSNPADCIPLTPNHFLHGQIGGKFAPESVDTTEFSPRKRWRRIQELVRHFWNRWLHEWLPSLRTSKNWHRINPDLKVNDVVIVTSNDLPRAQWPLGRITRVHTSRDGHVRAANVLMNGKEFVRPITKLCPLEINADD
ncbi:uncharacterized protein LOC128546731 [Mercenaria mercenaria]|uniref:uncharacterized protein LOC128546731 n=1 Tax=Mercenaria mercenaria TaxID=6596 RepID=UPI00234F344F|nr:uncharacterized protein LOC128546731 [Mercenaria mercenaria]